MHVQYCVISELEGFDKLDTLCLIDLGDNLFTQPGVLNGVVVCLNRVLVFYISINVPPVKTVIDSIGYAIQQH